MSTLIRCLFVSLAARIRSGHRPPNDETCSPNLCSIPISPQLATPAPPNVVVVIEEGLESQRNCIDLLFGYIYIYTSITCAAN